MTKKEAIIILLSFVEDHIVSGGHLGFEDSPVYEEERKAIKTIRKSLNNDKKSKM